MSIKSAEKHSKSLIYRAKQAKKREQYSENGRPISILKEDQLLDIIRKFQQVMIETVKIRFEKSILNDSILLKL